MRIITIASQKGGTGKTTTAAAVSCWAARHGIKTLAVDLDPQGSLTHILGGSAQGEGAYGFLRGSPAEEVIQATKGFPDLIPASLQLAGADAEFAGSLNRDFFLRRALKPLEEKYKLVLIDTPPTLGTLLVNALTASNEVIIPVQADTFAMQSVYQMLETIKQIREYCNKTLKVDGVLLTRYSKRTILSRDHREDLEKKCKKLGLRVFKTAIRDGVAVKEAQTMKKSLFSYAAKAKPTLDYEEFIAELKLKTN